MSGPEEAYFVIVIYVQYLAYYTSITLHVLQNHKHYVGN